MKILDIDSIKKIIRLEMYNARDNEKYIKEFIRDNISQHPDRLGYRFIIAIKSSENPEFYLSTIVTDIENIKISFSQPQRKDI